MFTPVTDHDLILIAGIFTEPRNQANERDRAMPEKALTKVEQTYQNRSSRAEQLKAEGKKIIGYFCCLTPVEVITAAGLIPYAITGYMKEAVTKVDNYLEVIACPYTRNCLELALRGEYDFLDGFVAPHSCDNIVKLYDIWKHNTKPTYSHFINVPHTRSRPSHEFLLAELGVFRKSLERLAGKKITDDKLSEAIRLHNENRALVRELYKLRKKDPPLALGSEIMKIISSILSLPIQESNEFLRDVIQELKTRGYCPQQEPARLLLYGSSLDNAEFLEMVEESGANVVMDDLCFGYRSFATDVEVSGNPLKNIADRYLDNLPCPRFCEDTVVSHQDDLEARFGYLRDYANDFDVNGVILEVVMNCDPYAFDAPELKEFLIASGLPVLVIEHDYTLMSIQRLKTQVKAFLEMLA